MLADKEVIKKAFVYIRDLSYKNQRLHDLIFYYDDNSHAAKDIEKIACYQEKCFKYICMVLKTKPTFKIHYFLCETPERVGKIYCDNEPCNGFASVPDKIYAVYNKNIKCIGFHEDAHLISYTINRPDNPF
ncbi:MAG: hypothetical protein K6G28_03395, partial [Acholeplasmatales bacterium]|nr:hypothetical protein [Acholeplasmatales bacterium]